MFWHQIIADPVKTTIVEPLGKIGLVWRIPSKHLSINPYVGYAQEIVRTKAPFFMGGNSRNRSDIVVYGVSAYWHWRMLGADAKYYLSQDLDKDEVFQHFLVWGTAMFNQKVGVIARFEYEEQSTIRDTSLLVGPAFVF